MYACTSRWFCLERTRGRASKWTSVRAPPLCWAADSSDTSAALAHTIDKNLRIEERESDNMTRRRLALFFSGERVFAVPALSHENGGANVWRCFVGPADD